MDVDYRYADVIVDEYSDIDLVTLILHEDGETDRALLLTPVEEPPSWCEVNLAGRAPMDAAQWRAVHALHVACRWVSDLSWDASDHVDAEALQEMTWEEEPAVVRYWGGLSPLDDDRSPQGVATAAVRGALSSGLAAHDVLRLDNGLPLAGPEQDIAQAVDRAHTAVHRLARRALPLDDLVDAAEQELAAVLSRGRFEPGSTTRSQFITLARRYITCALHPERPSAQTRFDTATAALRRAYPHIVDDGDVVF
ncbi:hypothetical protein [Microbacterium sp. NPDC055683]